MLSALSGAQSGLRVASVRLDVAAINITNANTAGFQPSQVVSVEAPDSGVTPMVTPAEPVDGPPAMSAAHLVTQVVAMILARHAFSANASARETAATREQKVFETLA